MIERLNLSIKKVKALWLVSLVGLFTLGLTGVIAPGISSAQGTRVASCSITGVPATVTDGEGVTPTVTVTNNSSKTFTTTVNVVEELVQKGGGKGGAGNGTVTVAPGQSAQFQGGTIFAETGYRIKIVAKSVGKPHFGCRVAVAKPTS